MSVLQKSNKRASARQQIDIKGVRDGILILPRNHYRMVLAVSPVNFELKSEDEQDAIIDTYGVIGKNVLVFEPNSLC